MNSCHNEATPPLFFFFYFSYRELTIQMMRCAITLGETFYSVIHTDVKLEFDLITSGLLCVLERALIFLRLRRSLRDLFFFHFSLISCRRMLQGN